MSRVGKMPVTIPAGVDVAIKQDQISVKGTGGALSLNLNALVTITSDAGKLSFVPANDSREADAMSGTMRQLVNNMVVGVTKGFEKKLNLVGVGYKAQAAGTKLNLTVGYSHPVDKEMPAGISVATPTPTEIVIKGADRQRVGRSPLRFVLFVLLNPTRARESVIRTRRSRSKKPRRSKGRHHVDQKRTASASLTSNPHSHCDSGCGAVDGESHQLAYIRQRHLRRRLQGAGSSIDRGRDDSCVAGRVRQGWQHRCCNGYRHAYR